MRPDAVTLKRPAAWKLALNILLLLGLVGVFAWQVKGVWPRVVSYNWNLDWSIAGLSLAALLLCSLLDILIWNRTLSWFTTALPFRAAAPVYIWSTLGRYVPGKVVSLFLRMALATQADRPAIPTLAASTVELALRTASALLLGFVALLGWHAADGRQQVFMVSIIAIIVITLICAHPKIMLPTMNWGLRKINEPTITRKLRYREVLAVLATLFVRWVFFGLAFYLLATAIYPPARPHAMMLVAAGPGSWAIGFMSMLPGGLGAMELVMKSILMAQFGFTNANTDGVAIVVIIVMLSRLWTLISEGAWGLISVPLWSRRPRAAAPALSETAP